MGDVGREVDGVVVEEGVGTPSERSVVFPLRLILNNRRWPPADGLPDDLPLILLPSLSTVFSMADEKRFTRLLLGESLDSPDTTGESAKPRASGEVFKAGAAPES